MNSVTEHDYLKSYELACAALESSPEDKALQHTIVLSLARLGALDFAAAEYTRFGLDGVDGHEDIMALAGRLKKDLFARSSGLQALANANASAQKYDAAFQSTKGYYSGINAATMALMADMPETIVTQRASAILDSLPLQETLTASDHYFVEATRAEALLLLGNTAEAQTSLRSAIAFDPLNYTAHAATLKQFKMILEKRAQSPDWLAAFKPPRPIHYAGHINLALSETESKALALAVEDYFQKNDIGFGFGALAAGSDIIFAEALLAEGAQLHVILPCAHDVFIEKSVTPFGGDWTKRHHDCLARAASVTVVAEHAPWPDASVNRFSGQYAMGQAVLRGHSFCVSPLQFLIWDQKKGGSYTALHSADWLSAQREQIVISHRSSAEGSEVSDETAPSFGFMLRRAGGDKAERYETIDAVMAATVSGPPQGSQGQLALHVDIPGEDTDALLQTILAQGAPSGILMTEAFASLLAHFKGGHYDITFAGLIGSAKDALRCYALNGSRDVTE